MIIFETSWEVCNKVGGIYTVLSTRARTMQQHFHDQVFFFGPDLGEHSNHFFQPDPTILPLWSHTENIRIGRWQVPGNPIAILVDYHHLFAQKNEIYAWAWQYFQVQSHAAYGDYDDSSLFGYAVGQAMQSLYEHLVSAHVQEDYIAHMNEWQTAFTLFYLRHNCARIRTLFTTHATGIGRSIAGNGKPLYDYFQGYHGDQMAEELGMVSKHSAEKQAAHHAHCFTTVSELTARECDQLLERKVDIVTPNGFEMEFVPTAKAYTSARQRARRLLKTICEQRLGTTFQHNVQFIGIAGRLEWKNKGIDLFLDLANQLQAPADTDRVMLLMIPYLDQVSHTIRDGVHVVFLPYLLDGTSPLGDITYYDLLIGLDATIFPSYYEPWGYTPLESVAFGIPTITTTLTGFGLWVGDSEAVAVIHRTDSNTDEVIRMILARLEHMLQIPAAQMRPLAQTIARKTTWEQLFPYYLKAYHIALEKN